MLSDHPANSSYNLRVFIFLYGLTSHFGPGQQVVVMAKAIKQLGHDVQVFIERPVAPENGYLFELRAAGIAVRTPGRWLSLAERYSRVNEVIWLSLAPIRFLVAAADMLIRRRSFNHAWLGVRGRFERLFPPIKFAEPCRWAMWNHLGRAHTERPAHLIHTLSGMGCSFAWAKQAGVPLLHTEMAIPTVEHGVDWWPDLRSNLDAVDEMTVVSHAVAEGVRNYLGYQGPIEVIPNMIPSDAMVTYRGKPKQGTLLKHPDTLIIGVAARLDPMKGHRYLIDAVPKLLETCSDIPFEVWLTGDGPAYWTLQTQIDALGLGSIVKLLGHYDADMMKFFWQATDLLVLPTLWDGLPVSVLEAMAHSKPVVASAVDGVPEAVQDGVTGLLVPPADSDALFRAIAELLHSPKRRQEMGQAGYQRFMTRYQTDVVITTQIQVYERVVKRGKHRSFA